MATTFQFQFSPKAERNFSQLSKSLQERILNKLVYFERSENPLRFAKKLVGAKDYFRFRLGDYRVIVKSVDATTVVVLLIVKIAHRREVYDEL